MTTTNFSTTLIVDQSPKEVFTTIKNVRGWWSGLFGEEIKGSFDKLNDEFSFLAGGGMHYSKQKLIELIPDTKIVWLVTESKLTFLSDETEWVNTKISFEILRHENKTHVGFTHVGLSPKIECYDQCSSGWSRYLQEILLPLISKSKG